MIIYTRFGLRIIFIWPAHVVAGIIVQRRLRITDRPQVMNDLQVAAPVLCTLT